MMKKLLVSNHVKTRMQYTTYYVPSTYPGRNNPLTPWTPPTIEFNSVAITMQQRGPPALSLTQLIKKFTKMGSFLSPSCAFKPTPTVLQIQRLVGTSIRLDGIHKRLFIHAFFWPWNLQQVFCWYFSWYFQGIIKRSLIIRASIPVRSF